VRLEDNTYYYILLFLFYIFNVNIVFLLYYYNLLQALDATASSDKELRNFVLTEDEWNKIEEIVSVLVVSKLLLIF
jgi:hypothetical protein